MFGKINKEYFHDNIDLSTGSWLKDLKKNIIFDEECLSKIHIAMKNEERANLVLHYLIESNDIAKFKAFIKVWKKHSPAKAKQFEKNLKNRISEEGLTEIDESILAICEYLAAYTVTTEKQTIFLLVNFTSDIIFINSY